VAPEGRGRAAGATLACLAAFAIVAWQVARQGPLIGLDHAILGWFVAHRSDGLTRVMLAVSEIHKTVPVLVAAVLLAGWQALCRRKALAVEMLLIMPGGMLLNFAMKHVVQRVRPGADEALERLASFSFPSGHAAATTVLYGALSVLVFEHTRSPRHRRAALMVAGIMVVFVATSRMYLGAHYFSDVLGGVLLACAWVAFVRGVLR
jgi:undecaprenyl-diphosphatase